MEILQFTRMPDTRWSEDINAQYRTKIPVFDTHVDDADSEDYLMFKVTRVPQKVLDLVMSTQVSLK